jgi:hypothetical protein
VRANIKELRQALAAYKQAVGRHLTPVMQ